LNSNDIKEKDISGRVYSIVPLNATIGLDISQKIFKTFGPALGVLIDTAGGSSSVEDEAMNLDLEREDLWMELAMALTSSLDSLDLTETSKTLMKGVYCDGAEISYERHFAGNYGEYIAVLEFILKENFGSFFTGYLKAKGIEIHTLRTMMSRKKEQNQEESES